MKSPQSSNEAERPSLQKRALAQKKGMRASLLARRIGRQSQNVAGLFGSGFGGGFNNQQHRIPVRFLSGPRHRVDGKPAVEKSTDKKPAEAKEWTLEKSFWTHPFVLRMLGYFGAER